MIAQTWTAADAARALTVPTAGDDKYSRGVVGLRTGSESYPGAAVLGVEAAWRTGIGMVRYLGPDRPTSLVLHRRPETVTQDGRVQAWVIGSGTDAAHRSEEELEALRAILGGDAPVVVDAGALDLVPGARAPLLVTPHASEHAKLRRLLGLADDSARDDDEREASALETARSIGGTVLLKGSVTIIACATGWSTRVDSGTPWLATAGTGDVLAGAVGALTAGQAVRAEFGSGGSRKPADPDALGRIAATGAWLHGRAASRAAADLGHRGGPITALDVAEALAATVAETIAGSAAP